MKNCGKSRIRKKKSKKWRIKNKEIYKMKEEESEVKIKMGKMIKWKVMFEWLNKNNEK